MSGRPPKSHALGQTIVDLRHMIEELQAALVEAKAIKVLNESAHRIDTQLSSPMARIGYVRRTAAECEARHHYGKADDE